MITTPIFFPLPIANVKAATSVEAFDTVFTELTEKGHKQIFNVTDNQAINPLQKNLQSKNCRWKSVEPTNHQVNAEERVIQMFKHQFISGLCSTDSECPLQLWDQLAHQAAKTLNILRKSRIDPKKSAYHQLRGHRYNYNAQTMAPLCTRAVITLYPDSCTSWGAWGINAWYCGPFPNNYHNYVFYIPKTRSYRISGSFNLLPQHCLLSQFTPIQYATEVLS